MSIIYIAYNRLFYKPFIKTKINKVGSNFKLGHNSEILSPKNFFIGNDFYAGPFSYFSTNDNCPVIIGNAVMFGPGCKILGGNHDIKYNKNHMYYNTNIDHMNSKIEIEDGVWIGANSVILSNAKISEGVIVGAMSLVNNFIPPYTITMGIPARKILRRFDKMEELIEMIKNVNSKYTFEEINKIYKSYNINYL